MQKILKLLSKLKIIFLPLSKIYGGFSFLHRNLYQVGILPYHKFDIPIINIGNLAFGGTGKSPHVLWVHDFLALQEKKIALVSRGYNRKNKNLLEVQPYSSAKEVGDEPFLFKQKLPNAVVVVSSKRSLAVAFILKNKKEINLVILDDAFQHWAIHSSLHILLTTFQRPFFDDNPPPLGYLREDKSGYQRADIIIVSKCPKDMSLELKIDFITKIKAAPHQAVFFSSYIYNDYYALGFPQKKIALSTLQTKEVLVVTAIANTVYLEQFIAKNTKNAYYLRFADHHYFTPKDLDKISLAGENKLIITTEKDATRLLLHQAYIHKKNLKIYCLPIAVKIMFEEQKKLKAKILDVLGQPS